MSRRRLVSLLLIACADAGCARDLVLSVDDPLVASDAGLDPDGAVLPPGGPHVRYASAEGGHTVTVDATDQVAWVHLDLDSGTELTPADPSADTAWDLAFRRSNVAANGGASGAGNVAVAWSDALDWSSVAVPDASAFAVDAPDSDDGDALPDFALADWYDYDVMTHVLTPRDRIIVVRSSAGAYFKIRILRYYDTFGTSGRFTLQVAPLDG